MHMHALEGELRDYLRWSSSIAGMRSVQGALEARAKSGAYGAHTPRSPEDAWSDRVGDGGRRDRIRSCSLVSIALRQLDARPRDVLLSAFMPVDWKGVVEDRYGKGKPFEELSKRVGDRIGVALLTDGVREGFGREQERTALEYGETVQTVRHESDAAMRARLRRAASELDPGSTFTFEDVEGPMLDAVGTLIDVERNLTRVECYRFIVGGPTPDEERRNVIWNTPLGWLVALAIIDDKKRRAERDELFTKVKAEGWGLFKDAMKRYAVARGEEVPEFDDERRDREQKDRQEARQAKEPGARRWKRPSWIQEVREAAS